MKLEEFISGRSCCVGHRSSDSSNSNSPISSNSSVSSTDSSLLEKLSEMQKSLENHTSNLHQEQLKKPTFLLTKIPEPVTIDCEQPPNINIEAPTQTIQTSQETQNVTYELTQEEQNMLEKMSNDDIKKAMLKLENIKNDIEDEINNVLYNEEVMESRRLRKEKTEKRKRDEKLSVFESDKTYTYKKIYADMFINTNKNGDHYIQSWDQVPELFVVKYAIFLFMDGRDVNGEQVRERLLDTENEYVLYEMLYNVLTNENYSVPDDEKLREIAEEFINTLPPIQIITEEQIMRALNDPDDPIFNEDETSQCSACDEYEDTKISTYQM
jgi:hypothetical protein